MTKKKLGIIAASSVGVFMVVALTVGVMYKFNKTQEYEQYLTQQEQQEQQEQLEQEQQAAKEKAASEAAVIPIAPIGVPKAENKNPPPIALPKANKSDKATQSAPEITVSTDENGNQTITPEWEKPAPPPHEDVHNPESKPDTPSKPETPAPGTPNDKGEIYVPGFGWMKPTGGKSEVADFELSGNLVGY